MEYSNWKKEEIEHLRELWEVRPVSFLSHTREKWNAAAHDWERALREDPARREREEKRAGETAAYLIRKGALTADTRAIDIGCGPGRSVAELARTAAQVTGLDISDAMAEYGRAFCLERGLSNVSFLTADFRELDIAAEGLTGKYDLVFSSMSPALGHRDGFRKALELTNGWFFNVSIVRDEDSLQKALEERCGFRAVRSRDGTGSYCMLAELVLEGYHPELTYYYEAKRESFSVEEAASEYGKWFFRDGAAAEQRDSLVSALRELADPDGRVLSEKKRVYSWLLVDKQGRNVHGIVTNNG